MGDVIGNGKGFLRKAAERARHAADALRDEYRKGKDGDESPVQPIAPSAIDVIKVWMSRSGESGPDSVGSDEANVSGATDTPSAPSGIATDPDETTQAASQVAALLAKANWRSVAEAARDNAAAQRMRELAEQVDWAAAKPVAARLATVLIAAAAAGELGGLQGASGRYVARTVANELGLADRVAHLLNSVRNDSNQPLVDYIDATATEMENGTAVGNDPPDTARQVGFEERLLDLGRLRPGDHR